MPLAFTMQQTERVELMKLVACSQTMSLALQVTGQSIAQVNLQSEGTMNKILFRSSLLQEGILYGEVNVRNYEPNFNIQGLHFRFHPFLLDLWSLIIRISRRTNSSLNEYSLQSLITKLDHFQDLFFFVLWVATRSLVLFL